MFSRIARLGFVVLVICLFVGAVEAYAEEADKGSPQEDLTALIKKINSKIKEGKRTKEDLAEETKEFDKLLKKYKGQKTDEVARILYMKGTLHQQVFGDDDTALKAYVQLKSDFPDTTWAKTAEVRIAAAKLKVGTEFPDFQKKDLEGNPLSVSKFRNKVVLVDFWATWCPPCVGELPNVIEAYKKHHAKGFEIIGISLDQDRKKLTSFIKEKGVTWPQYFDGKGWQNELAQKYGIQGIPATFLLGPDGKIIGKNLRGPSLEAAISKALDRPQKGDSGERRKL